MSGASRFEDGAAPDGLDELPPEVHAWIDEVIDGRRAPDDPEILEAFAVLGDERSRDLADWLATIGAVRADYALEREVLDEARGASLDERDRGLVRRALADELSDAEEPSAITPEYSPRGLAWLAAALVLIAVGAVLWQGGGDPSDLEDPYAVLLGGEVPLVAPLERDDPLDRFAWGPFELSPGARFVLEVLGDGELVVEAETEALEHRITTEEHARLEACREIEWSVYVTSGGTTYASGGARLSPKH